MKYDDLPKSHPAFPFFEIPIPYFFFPRSGFQVSFFLPAAHFVIILTAAEGKNFWETSPSDVFRDFGDNPDSQDLGGRRRGDSLSIEGVAIG